MNETSGMNTNHENMQKSLEDMQYTIPDEGCCSPEFTEGCILETDRAE